MELQTSTDAASQKSLIKNAEPTEKFTVQGIVMSDGNDGVTLEVLDLSIAPKMLYVCNHEAHDSYSMNQEFPAEYNDKLVGATGVKIKRTGDASEYSYELVIKTPVKLNWTDDKSSQKTSDISNITNNIHDGEETTSIEFEITGFLRIADDGSQTIDVMDFKPLNQAVSNFMLFANSGSSANTFYSYSVPNISAVTTGGVPTTGAENYRFFYRLATAPADEVKARLAAGEELIDIKNDYLKEAEEKLYDPETFDIQTESYFIDAYSCTPGRINPNIPRYFYIEKVSKSVTTLDEVINGSYSYSHVVYTSTSTPNAYFVEKPLRVLGVNANHGYLAITMAARSSASA